MIISAPLSQPNNTELKGKLASKKVQFGDRGRYLVFAVHTRTGHLFNVC